MNFASLVFPIMLASIPDLTQLILGRFHELTGVKVGTKVKIEEVNPKPKREDIDHEWAKIKPIISKEKFYKVSFGVFISNINRGKEFL